MDSRSSSPSKMRRGSEDENPDWLNIEGAVAETETGPGADEDLTSLKISSPANGDRCQPSLPFYQRAQFASIIISLLLSPAAVVLVCLWASSLGGVWWAQGEAPRVFNWHPVLMVSAYALINAGALVFRVTGTSSHQTPPSATAAPSDPKKRGRAKMFHASVWSLSFVFGTVAMLAVFKSHNDPISGYIANLYSLHSWVGVLVLTLYSAQFLVGLLAFGGLRSERSRLSSPALMAMHKYTGACIHALLTTTVLLGIQEKEGFVSCSYVVETADLVPLLNYGKIPYSCKVSHGLGLVVLVMGLCTSFGLAHFPAI